MKTQSYLKFFTDENRAHEWMRIKNRAARDGGLFCLVDGPEDNFAVVDLATAIDLGGPYTWSR